jgi:hypothetical protein
MGGRGVGGSQDKWGWSLGQSMIYLKYNIKSFIFYKSQTFPNLSSLNSIKHIFILYE